VQASVSKIDFADRDWYYNPDLPSRLDCRQDAFSCPENRFEWLDYENGFELAGERKPLSYAPEQKTMLERLSPHQVRSTDLAGEKMQKILTQAPGNGAPIGGIKVMAATGRFAAFRI
jgi:phosphoglucomutase